MPKNLVDMFFNTVKNHTDKVALRYLEEGSYKDMTYAELSDKVYFLASGLDEIGVEQGDNIAIISESRPEWWYSDMAILSLRAVTVPIYPTLTANQVEFMLNDALCKAVIISQPEHLEIIKEIFNNLKAVKNVITLFDHTEESSLPVMSMRELLETGRSNLDTKNPLLAEKRSGINESDLATIIYTSGTTGEPKGVMLSHHNFVSNVEMALAIIHVREEDTWLSFLPLSHSLERTVGYYTPLYMSNTVSFAENVQTVGDNMREVKPTMMACVPRLFEKMYNLVQDSVAKGSPVKKLLFKWCITTGKKHFEKSKTGKVSPLLKYRQGIADKLVFSKLKARTGGNMRLFFSGGAPLPPQIGEFFAYAGMTIIEGYGLTETSPIISGNPVEDFRFGTVGKALEGIEVKISEDGEICTRGPHVMMGYYNNPEATKEIIDEEGWLHTGDIGEIDADGYIKITDRKKNIIVTSGGKNIAPQRVENAIITSRYVEQILLIGDNRPFPSALIVPSFENLKHYYKLNDISFAGIKEMLQDERTYTLIEEEIKRLSGDLAQFEKIKKFTLIEREFSQENGEMTPTMKIKKRVVEKTFAKEIESMYSQ